MRKVMMTMMVLLLAVAVATAQRGKGHRADNLLEKLDLSSEQQAQIKALREDDRTRMHQLREQKQAERPDRETMKKMREDANAKIQTVLTPEQQKKLEALKAERKAAWEGVDEKAMRADLKAHTETSIKPVIAAARARFDQVISAEDKATIERLRPIFAKKPSRQGMRTGTDINKDRKAREEARTAQRVKMGKWESDHPAEIAELKSLTSKYATDLKSLLERMAPQQEKWAKEKREIAARYLPEGATGPKGPHKKARQQKGKNKGKADHLKKGRAEGKAHDWPRSAAFLLMKG